MEDIELEPIEDAPNSEDHAEDLSIQWYEFGCCVLAITYCVLIPFCPYFFFKYAIETDNFVTNDKHYCCFRDGGQTINCYTSNSFNMTNDFLTSWMVNQALNYYDFF